MRLPLLKTLRLPRSIPLTAIGPFAFLIAGALSLVTATWAAGVVERRSAEGIAAALAEAGHTWAEVTTDGLQVELAGTAPTEAARFRALSVAGTIVDSDRVIDAMDVVDPAALKAPDFTIEILRNGDGISLIGLVPAGDGREKIVEDLTKLAGDGSVTDMLEAADHPVPAGWQEALGYGIKALASLPRAKISISADKVSITAISDSPAEKARLESDLSRKAPKGIHLALDISAPRPVITPFTLRFLIDENGARFDACSADSDRARDRILAAATEAGATRKNACTIGLGVPTPAWADAVTMGLAAMKELGAGSITFSDADISLIAAETVSQEAFDRVVGELESNLPEVFSLHATLTPKASDVATAPVAPEFNATLSSDGRLDMRGRLGDELSREAVESFARSRFGSGSVHAATRLAPDMPMGWPIRVLAALEALGELDNGAVQVRPEIIRITGITGSTSASDTVARLLSDRLGEGANYELNIRYDETLDPLLGLPTDEECAGEINAILAAHKINFEPGSAQITADGRDTLDKIAERMKDCADFPMEVGGHTDSQGREEMNLALSTERAQAVIAALMNRRVLTGNLTAEGYGETVPIADNDTEEGREANRRIEFRLVKPQVAATPADAEDMTGDPEIEITVQTPDDDTPKPKARPERTGEN
ncbi:OmpA family protein [Defluviimonas sp. SAOS-178_SWC]|uniref:OmpA family protein n=1 Tax=Defluviimonas sp. SAOS-178_SWC TaxID=3121287 RepID=UPI0032220F18